MAWNKTENKTFASPASRELKVAQISVGAPISYQGGQSDIAKLTGYHDGWDIEKAYKEGVAKVTWVFRCLDVIASNQARLPMTLRKDNSPFGEIVRDKTPLLTIFNNTTNMGENAFAFRYRLSAQLLISSRGVFVEIVRNRAGTPIALHLLPPQNTAPIPDAERFVAGFVVRIPGQQDRVLPSRDVIWIRRPHPLDPYLSMTPMEAAGVAIEVENLAKIYNRNFLLNDGRPGGLLVLNGDVEQEDRDELVSRFGGGIARTGSVGVIAMDGGVDFVDTGANPRDAAYIQMRTLTKEEILASFGVPESIIGNSSGRTFANAAEEGRVFWMETMSPHLEMIARAFDPIDEQHFIGFDTSNVPVLVLSQQERDSFHLQEVGAGLISTNEYRKATGRQEVESELADAILANPNLTPIANTEHAMNSAEAAGVAPQNVEQQPSDPGVLPEGAEPVDAPVEAPTDIEAGVPIDVQSGNAAAERVTEFDIESGEFVPSGTVEGTRLISAPASAVPSELEE